MQDFAITLPLSDAPVAMVLTVAIILNYVFCREGLITRVFGTPLALAGGLIDRLEKRYNREELTEAMHRADGWSVAFSLVIVAGTAGFAADLVVRITPYAWVGEAFVVATLLAMRTHLDQNRGMAAALHLDEEEARASVAYISGRNTAGQDRAELSRTAIEQSASALSAGMVASILYYLLLGLPGLFIFRIINLAHNMLSERSDSMAAFEAPFAIMNRVLSFPAAVLTVPLLALVRLPRAPRDALGALYKSWGQRDRYFDRALSLPAAALAFSHGIRLGGSAQFADCERKGQWINRGGVEPGPEDLNTVWESFFAASLLLWLGGLALALSGILLPADILSDLLQRAWQGIIR